MKQREGRAAQSTWNAGGILQETNSLLKASVQKKKKIRLVLTFSSPSRTGGVCGLGLMQIRQVLCSFDLGLSYNLRVERACGSLAASPKFSAMMPNFLLLGSESE